ncbi:MAG TPA: TerC family protein [Anaerolineae bacterium]|nr:TerC family protein [Anaerolineae bacterium]
MADLVVPFVTLAALEIILGIDNIIFISILSAKLPKEEQSVARRLGIGLAVGSRLLLLLSISFVIRLGESDVLSLFGNGLTGKDLILLGGGLFLIGKSTYEIHEKLEAVEHGGHGSASGVATMKAVLLQIILVDVVFSLDSVITAVGITDNMGVMVGAIVSAAAVMLFFANPVADFVDRHPTMKILALAFLILIGSLLMIEGWNPEAAHDLHLKNYVYFAMAFSFGVELLNMQFRKPDPVKLHNRPNKDAMSGD